MNDTVSLLYDDSSEYVNHTSLPFNSTKYVLVPAPYKPIDYVNMAVLPVCLIGGLVGNTFTVIGMNSKRISSLYARYFLIGLALADMSVLLTQPLKNMIVIRWIGTDIRSLTNFGCKFYFWLHRTGKMMSSWLVALVAIERLVAVRSPFMVKQWFSKRNSVVATVTLTTIIGVFNLIYSVYSEIDDNGICNPDMYNKNDSMSVSLNRICLGVGVTLYFIAPLAILVVTIPAIIFSLLGFERTRKALVNHAQLKDNNITKPTLMLLGVALAYIVFVTPIGFLRILVYVNPTANIFAQGSTWFGTYRDVAHVLEIINYSLNFYLYVGASKQFRQALVDLICGGERTYRSPRGTVYQRRELGTVSTSFSKE